MTDVPPSYLGEPRRFWTPTPTTAMPARRPAPDLSDPAEFAARVEVRSPAWQGPVLLAGLALLCLACSLIPGVEVLFLPDGSGPAALRLLAGALAAAAAAVLVWDLRTRAAAYRRAHEHGRLAQGYLTSLDVGREGHRPAWVLVDARVPDEQAARLYSAFDTWIDAVLADPGLRRRVVRWFRGRGMLVPSETLFGPDAAGAHLTGPLSPGHWKLLTPKGKAAPPETGGAWRVRPVLYADPDGRPVPTLGSGG